MRYIGSKERLAAAIVRNVGQPDGGVFVDAFCGTGAVGVEAARRGWPVRLNDHLLCATILAGARLLAAPEVPFAALGGYAKALARLQTTPPAKGFVWSQYSPASTQWAAHERRYFTEMNAARIDGTRRQIATWRDSNQISDVEERLLIADLLVATSRVANTAGTYGCFLRQWSGPALKPLIFVERELLAAPVPHEVHVGDVALLPFGSGDTGYFDPPYTKRQYAAYYHVLETVAHGDEPNVSGLTGLRPWRDKASEFCYKTRALSAITRVLRSANARRLFLSYSNEGHISLRSLENAVAALGNVTVQRLPDLGRYRPNRVASTNGSLVEEYLLSITRTNTFDSIEPADTDAAA